MTGHGRQRTVIIGAGQAGAWAAITLRQADPDREIILIGQEAYAPYERPPVSKEILSRKAGIESATIRPAADYESNGIQLMLATRVEGIDRASGRVHVGSDWVGYDSLILATGARPRRLPSLPSGSPNIFYLRELDDALALRSRLQPDERVAILGAGFIGLEVAAVAVANGCETTVLDTAAHPLSRVLDREVAAVFSELHQLRGVDLRLRTMLAHVEDRGANGLRMTTARGEAIEADLIVVGIGAVPNTELAEEAGLDVADGIVVDAFGRTSDPAIFAAGDVTRHFNPLLKRSLRLESWQNAQNQAIAVARVVAGGQEPYAEIPWFWTDQYGNNFQIAGAPEGWDQIVWRGDGRKDRFTALYLHNGRVVAGNTFNNGREMRFVKQLIAGGAAMDASGLADPKIPLKEFCQA